MALLTQASGFVMPDIFPLELASGLLRKERRGEVAFGTAAGALRDFDLLDIELVPHAPLLAEATALASQRRHGVYDCLFLMLGRDRNLPVATFDGPMTQLALQLGIRLWTPE
jgi:predicted nucleic acid-binding protein